MRALIVAFLLLAPSTVKADGAFALPGYVQLCSQLADPGHLPVTVSTTDDLQTVFDTNCGSGCTLELEGGNHDDVNLDVGTGDFSGPNDAGTAIVPTGEVLIRAADPANRPVLRASIDEPGPIIEVLNAAENDYFRLENIDLDGRRADQTNLVFDLDGDGNANELGEICEDTDGDDVCDSGESSTLARGINVKSTTGTHPLVCLRNVHGHETVGNVVAIRDAAESAVEGGVFHDGGCAPDTCPNLNVPARANMSSTLTSSRGVNLSGNVDGVAVLYAEAYNLTKMGFQCFRTTGPCAILDSYAHDVLNSGFQFVDSKETLIRGNRSENIGFLYAMPSTTTFSGFGIGGSTNGAHAARVEGNVVENTWGAGIQVGGTSASSGAFTYVRNTVTKACQGTTRTDRSDVIYGDAAATDTIPEITSIRNTLDGGSDCLRGMLARNVTTQFRSYGDLIKGTRQDEAARMEGSVDMDIREITLDDDLVLESGSTGSIDGCTFNADGTLVDNSGGGVAVSNCP